ncbi:MAG TPA: enoyl-CoA hydratase/isomerase family protein [Sandaracinaceae bacterium LLY-WYZ-13_1]|nr:enoyl-CoA hydratase/isomerase family protein [Sandaracinaceae bacterium LLY-WYZ-13_1]
MLDVETHDAVARLTLRRPEVRNALSPALLETLIDACEGLHHDDALRVVVLRGADGTFCGGADLPGFLTRFGADDPEAVADLGRRAAEAVAALPAITVAAIEGHCVGGGVVLAGACDLRWAAPDARLCVPELALGIPLAWGGLERLVRLVGESAALELVLGCERVDAAEARRVGLLSAILEAPFAEHLEARLSRLADKPLGALRATKRQLRAIREGRFDAKADAGALVAALNDPESQRAAQAYFARRARRDG